jgi:hypothetical protein
MEFLLIGFVLFFLSFALFLWAGGFLLGFLGSLWSSSKEQSPHLFDFWSTLFFLSFFFFPQYGPPIWALVGGLFLFCTFRSFWVRHILVVVAFSFWTSTLLRLADESFWSASMKWNAALGFLVGTILGRLYAPYYFDGSEKTGAREWKWWRCRRMWLRIHKHFSFSIEYADEKSFLKEGPAIIGVHPHGLWNVSGPYGAGLHAGKMNFDFLMGLHWWLFWIPIVRDLCLWAGNIDVSKNVLTENLRNGKKIGLVPGGVQEIALSNVNSLDLYFGHQGFLRLAWEEKVPAVPLFSEGENRVWLWWNIWPTVREWFTEKIGYPFPLIFVPWAFGEKITMHVGNFIRPSECETYETFKKAYYAELFALIQKNETKYPISAHLKKEMEKILS